MLAAFACQCTSFKLLNRFIYGSSSRSTEFALMNWRSLTVYSLAALLLNCMLLIFPSMLHLHICLLLEVLHRFLLSFDSSCCSVRQMKFTFLIPLTVSCSRLTTTTGSTNSASLVTQYFDYRKYVVIVGSEYSCKIKRAVYFIASLMAFGVSLKCLVYAILKLYSEVWCLFYYNSVVESVHLLLLQFHHAWIVNQFTVYQFTNHYTNLLYNWSLADFLSQLSQQVLIFTFINGSLFSISYQMFTKHDSVNPWSTLTWVISVLWSYIHFRVQVWLNTVLLTLALVCCDIVLWFRQWVMCLWCI